MIPFRFPLKFLPLTSGLVAAGASTVVEVTPKHDVELRGLLVDPLCAMYFGITSIEVDGLELLDHEHKPDTFAFIPASMFSGRFGETALGGAPPAPADKPIKLSIIERGMSSLVFRGILIVHAGEF